VGGGGRRRGPKTTPAAHGLWVGLQIPAKNLYIVLEAPGVCGPVILNTQGAPIGHVNKHASIRALTAFLCVRR